VKNSESTGWNSRRRGSESTGWNSREQWRQKLQKLQILTRKLAVEAASEGAELPTVHTRSLAIQYATKYTINSDGNGNGGGVVEPASDRSEVETRGVTDPSFRSAFVLSGLLRKVETPLLF
jgi:hypothetical protein